MISMFKRKKSKALFIYSINLFNFLIIFILSFFREIIYWRSERVPLAWLARFQVIFYEDCMNVDQFHAQKNKIYKCWRDFFQNLLKDPQFIKKKKLAGLEIDFTNRALQCFSASYENHFMFLYLIAQWLKKNPEKKISIADDSIFYMCRKN